MSLVLWVPLTAHFAYDEATVLRRNSEQMLLKLTDEMI
jgi:hypothetical protein